jgi:hypothetical protein
MMHESLKAALLLAGIILMFPSLWLTFEKAKQPGWASLVPGYNLYLLCLMGGRPGWWVALMLVPGVNLVVLVMVLHGVSRAFGFGAGMTLLMLFLPFLAYPRLGFGKAEFNPPMAGVADR